MLDKKSTEIPWCRRPTAYEPQPPSIILKHLSSEKPGVNATLSFPSKHFTLSKVKYSREHQVSGHTPPIGGRVLCFEGSDQGREGSEKKGARRRSMVQNSTTHTWLTCARSHALVFSATFSLKTNIYDPESLDIINALFGPYWTFGLARIVQVCRGWTATVTCGSPTIGRQLYYGCLSYPAFVRRCPLFNLPSRHVRNFLLPFAARVVIFLDACCDRPQEELRKLAMASPAPQQSNSVSLNRETPRSIRKAVGPYKHGIQRHFHFSHTTSNFMIVQAIVSAFASNLDGRYEKPCYVEFFLDMI